MHKYVYNGPVEEYDDCIRRRWKSQTFAVSEKKARSNLAYQWKKANNLDPRTRVTLPGQVILAE